MRRGLIVLSLVIAVVALDRTVIAFTSPPTVGHFTSAEGRSSNLSVYHAALAEAPTPDISLDAPTSFGTAHAHHWAQPGTENEEPLVLVPGRASGAPMWNELLPELIQDRPVYIFDAIGDAGLSTQSTPFTSTEDQATWLGQAIEGLDLGTAHILGHSFGAASAASLALYRPELVASLTLLEPVFTLANPPASIFVWSAVIMLPLPQSWIDRGLAEIGGTDVEDVQERTPVSEMINAAAQHYSAQLPTPQVLNDEEISSLTMPVYVGIAAEKSLAGGDEAARRATNLLPNAHVKIWENTTHSLPFQVVQPLGSELRQFWNEG